MDRSAEGAGNRISVSVLFGALGVELGARGSAGAIWLLLQRAYPSRRAQERRADCSPRRAQPGSRRASIAAPFCRERRLVAGGPAAAGSSLCSACDRKERRRVRAWIVDDTGFPKKGVHSVGVARQYCGQLGKQDNCQIAVSLSVANEHASLPIAFRLYLPEDWAADPVRRARAGVPEDVVFKTKPQIALDQIRAARAEGVPEGVVLADAGYGINTAFRAALTRMGLTYVVGVQSSVRLWPPGAGPLPPKAWTGQGRPPTLMRRDTQNQPQSAKQLAKSLPADAWRDVAWREGVDKTLRSRFAAVRVRPAHRDYWRSHPYAEEWLLVEWPQDESAPDQILALDPGAGYSPRDPRGNCQTALADRARLSGTQAGTRPRSL